MEGYDILMVAVLAGATIFGAYKGLAWQVASISAIFASYFVAVKFREPVAEMIQAAPPWNLFLAMLILYVASSFAIWVAFRFVSQMIDRVKLKEFDRQIGALFGFAKGLLLCVLITLFAVTLSHDERRQRIVQSRSGYYIAAFLSRAEAIIPPEAQQVLAPYVDTLQSELEEPGRGESDAEIGESWPWRGDGDVDGETIRRRIPEWIQEGQEQLDRLELEMGSAEDGVRIRFGERR